MTTPRKPDFPKPAFTMNDHDRFYRIIVSDHIFFELSPDTETILTFVIISRATGTFSIVYVMKTFQKGICISRSVQDKKGITANDIDRGISKVLADFAQGVHSQTNCQIHWDALDLSAITDMKEQFKRIKKWGKLKVC